MPALNSFSYFDIQNSKVQNENVAFCAFDFVWQTISHTTAFLTQFRLCIWQLKNAK